MSSVLDIRYRKPNASKTRITASMLGRSSSAIGQRSRTEWAQKFTLNTGIRLPGQQQCSEPSTKAASTNRYVDVQGYAMGSRRVRPMGI